MIRVEAVGEEALLTVLDAGAEDAVEEGDGITVYTDMKDLHAVRQAIVDADLSVSDAELQYVANAGVPVADAETAAKVSKVLDAIEDLDDVVNVSTNAEFED